MFSLGFILLSVLFLLPSSHHPPFFSFFCKTIFWADNVWAFTFALNDVLSVWSAAWGGSCSSVNVYSRTFLRCALSTMPWRCLPCCGIVEFKRSSYDTDLGLLMKVLHQFFHVVKLKNFTLQFEKLWPQLWLAAHLPPRTGPALWIGFPFCFEGSNAEPSCLQIFLFVFWEKKNVYSSII